MADGDGPTVSGTALISLGRKEINEVKKEQKWLKYRGTMFKMYFTKCHSIAHVVPATPTNQNTF